MRRTRERQFSLSPARYVAAIAFGVALVGALTNFTGNGSGWARAAIAPCYYDVGHVSNFPIVGSRYESLDGTSYPSSPVPVQLTGLDLWNPSPPHTLQSVPLPPPGSSATVDSFFDVFLDLNFFGPGSQPFEGVFRIVGGGGGGGGGYAPDGTWPIELLSLNLWGDYPGIGPFMIRESPTLASVGEHTLHPMPGTPDMPGGSLYIDSFFDVFTELSLDGGQTWHPSEGPVRMSLTSIVPEPAAAALALVGAAAYAMMMRRRCG